MTEAFKDTRNLFILGTRYTTPLTFAEWKNIPRSQMSAVLFVQFYEEITLAWYKTRSFYTPEEDGVSTVCQYLEKNVDIILNDPKRFSSSYIYKVAYNCLYCICHDIKRDRDRWENETSNIVITDDGSEELDLFDTIKDATESPEHKYLDSQMKADFWETIAEGGDEAIKVVNHLLRGDSLKKCKCKDDMLKDVEVSVERMGEIIEDLKIKLARFRDCQ